MRRRPIYWILFDCACLILWIVAVACLYPKGG